MKRILIASLFTPLAIGLAACDVDQTKEGELPEVEVPDVKITMPDAEGTPVTGAA